MRPHHLVATFSLLGAFASTTACTDDLEQARVAVEQGALVQSFTSEPTVLRDAAAIDMYFEEVDGVLEASQYLGGTWVPTRGVIVDEVVRDDLGVVTTRLHPEPGTELRVRLRAADGTFGRWSAWTRTPVKHVIAVPAPGLEAALDFAVEQRTSHTFVGWVCYPTGCIKIKKLNSGG